MTVVARRAQQNKGIGWRRGLGKFSFARTDDAEEGPHGETKGLLSAEPEHEVPKLGHDVAGKGVEVELGEPGGDGPGPIEAQCLKGSGCAWQHFIDNLFCSHGV
eukprot:CAMPEP_0118988402 /NCGR_PEP_ID=MMETSP1173-20130426/46133_1 /TAXON_ID=1034831 /ORGANISM="Rhizochromulina marina cf, Strain CCMP1243" /LENGTH=103 /DNA_ID=CAMNT_0006939329 /DNA_START=173 /DNA_END=485 /DNA_ORIENTATION=+